MLVSVTIRGTLPAAAELLDGAFDVRLSHAHLPGAAGAIALEPTPASLLTVAAQRLPQDLGLGAPSCLARRSASRTRSEGSESERTRVVAIARFSTGSEYCSRPAMGQRMCRAAPGINALERIPLAP